MASTVASQSVATGRSSRSGRSGHSGLSDHSGLSGHSGDRSEQTDDGSLTVDMMQVTNPTQAPSEGALRPEEIDYDRRQIRLKLREKLEMRGDSVSDVVHGGEGDGEDVLDDYLYDDVGADDAEFFPWKRREAAVAAAVAGGRTEGRIEGFDSMERAMQAHKHKLHYGRGRGYGWSQQKTSRNMDTSSRRQLLTDWESFRALNKGQGGSQRSMLNGGDPNSNAESPEMIDFQRERKLARQRYWINTAMVVVSVGFVVGFVLLLENLKLGGYGNYLPKGYVPPDDNTRDDNTFSSAGVGLSRPRGGRRLAEEQQQTASVVESKLSLQTTRPGGRRNLERTTTTRQDTIRLPSVGKRGGQQRPRGRLLDHAETHPQLVIHHKKEEPNPMSMNPFDMMEKMFSMGDNVMMKLPAVPAGRRRLGESPSAQSSSSANDSRFKALLPFVITVSGQDVFQRHNTPQYRALKWLALEDGLQLPIPSNKIENQRLVQRYALATIHYATNGQLEEQKTYWKKSYNFLEPIHECEWNEINDSGSLRGVGDCDEFGNVRILSLHENELHGELPREIGLLWYLESLALYDNWSLEGIVPPEVEDLGNLKTFYIHRTRLQGNIDFLCKLPVLQDEMADCVDGQRGPLHQEARVTCSCCKQCCGPGKEEFSYPCYMMEQASQ